MKRLSVNILSSLIGILIALTATTVALLAPAKPCFNSLPLVLLMASGLGIVVFMLTRYLINRLLNNKIEPLNNIVYADQSLNQAKKEEAFSKHPGSVAGEAQKLAENNKEEFEKLKGAENYRKEFLGNVYHELKTPIFNMQGYILTLLEGGLEDDTINRVYLERADKNINRMISIVEDLETISCMEQGALNLKPETFSIKKLIEDVFDSNEMRASKHKIKLVTTKIRESDTYVRGDRKRIYQVVNNLVINSISYGSRGGKTTASVSSDSEKVYVRVKDNGIGISREDINRVFERFYRVDKSRSRNSGGTGLGLAIVKHIIEAHNQEVKVTSTPGKGTTFVFSLDRPVKG